MKKTLAVLLLFLCLFLCSCDPAEFYFDYESMKKVVASIELIVYDNHISKIVDVNSNTTLIFDEKKIISTRLLDDDKTDLILKDLSKITFFLRYESALEPIEQCLKITLNNGHFIILSCSLVDGTAYSMVGEFDSNCKYIKCIANFADRPSYEKMISKYFS